MTSPVANQLYEASVDHHARRVTIQAEISRTIDLHTTMVDPTILNQTDAERIRELVVTLGDVGAQETTHDQWAVLVDLASRVQGWLEWIAREQAA
jgi:hypothetical protein